MSNFKIISQALTQNNADMKNLGIKIDKINTSKEDSFIVLNTDALAGLELPENLSAPEISTDVMLDLFGFNDISALYYAIPTFDNKIFVLKATSETFNVGSTPYTIANCTPCIGKMIPYGSSNILMLTFLFNTFNGYLRIMTLYVDGHSSTNVKGRMVIDELSSGSNDMSNTIAALQGEVDTLKETSVTKTSLESTLETTLETVQQMIKDATNRIDGGIINSNNTPTVSGIGEITESNDILINEEMLSTGTYTLKYLDGNDNVVNNSKPITNFTI